MGKESAGLVVYRVRTGRVEVLLAHPGGPFWAKKDAGAWTIPKGEVEPGEDPLACARREVEEELGFRPEGTFQRLKAIQQKGGKIVHAWAVEGDFDASHIKSNRFSIEWPPRSGRMQEFPEIDRAAFFELADAEQKILPSQIPLLRQLAEVRGKGA